MKKLPWFRYLPWIIALICIPVLVYCYLIPPEQTTFFIVRHAEKTGSGLTDPLSSAGADRADELAFILEQVPLDGIYATEYLRTQQTAQVTATLKGMTITTYTASSDPATISTFLNGLVSAHKGKNVLIVGHSNTTPKMVNSLIGADTYSDIDENNYNNLFVVDVIKKGKAKVKQMQYDNQ